MIVKYGLLMFSVTALVACSTNGDDWPKLTDPLPDPADRERIQERADSSAKPRAGATETTDAEMSEDDTPGDKVERLQAVQEDLRALQKAYEDAFSAFEAATGEERLQDWQTAQMMLTRLSARLSDLEGLDASGTTALKDYIITERAKLTALEP